MKERQPVNLYKIHTLLLPSTLTLCSPLSCIPPVFGARVSIRGEPGSRPSRGAGRPPLSANAFLLAGRRLSAFPAVYIDPQEDKGYYTKPYKQ